MGGLIPDSSFKHLLGITPITLNEGVNKCLHNHIQHIHTSPSLQWSLDSFMLAIQPISGSFVEHWKQISCCQCEMECLLSLGSLLCSDKLMQALMHGILTHSCERLCVTYVWHGIHFPRKPSKINVCIRLWCLSMPSYGARQCWAWK